jgi:DNA-binding NarL/FixJ family response regulator
VTRVLLIDDHPIVLQGLRQLLRDAGIEDVLEAADLVAGYRLYRRHRPDVVVIDLAMPGSGLGGLLVIRRIRLHDPHVGILVFSMHGDPVLVSRALEAGANGYLVKDTDSAHLLEAFEAVRAGNPYLSHDLAMKVALLGRRDQQSPMKELTPREIQTLALLAEGKPYGAIAGELNVSYKTVANTCSQLKAKLGVATLPELMRFGLQYLAMPPLGLDLRSAKKKRQS